MRVLILTSELLNPENIIKSTFELSQAQILSEKHDVAILSVNIKPSLFFEVKQLLKRILRRSGNVDESIFEQCSRICRMFPKTFIRAGRLQIHIIEEITVYEAIGYSVFSKRGFHTQLKEWVQAGLSTYKKYVSENKRPDLIHAHGRFLNAGVLAVEIKKQYAVPYVYTEHSTYFQTGKALPESKPYFSEIIENASAYIAVSQSLLREVEFYLNVKISGAFIIPNVIDKIFEDPLTSRNQNKVFFSFINVAALDHKKGHDVLLRAFKLAFKGDNRIRLMICGDGPLHDDLIALRARLKLEDCVVFVGQKTKQEVKELLDQSDAFVLPSRVETFGVVVIEALARGIPVIATRSGGPEYILSEDCGILVEPDLDQELAEALLKIFNHIGDYDRYQIREFALQGFGSSAFFNSIDKIYKAIA